MGPLEITGTGRLILGLATGIAFGFILQKAQVTRYDKIVAFYRLTDMTVLKVMFGGILAGMIGVYLLNDLGLVNLHIKSTLLAANILGGAIFGVGMLLLGFWPGTCAGALGEGRVDGLLRGILGILIGAGLYSEVYPLIQNNLLKMGAYGKLTIPGLLGVNHWLVIVPMVIGCGALLVWLDRKGLWRPLKTVYSRAPVCRMGARASFPEFHSVLMARCWGMLTAEICAMHVSAQISLYPLRQDHLSPAIQEMQDALRVAGLDVTPGPMSTMVTGDGAAVLEALKIAFLRTAATGHIVMTATISNACPI